MKRKALAFFLCIALCLLVVPDGGAAADGGLTFVSVNDTLPRELLNCVTSHGGAVYAPYYLFTGYGLGISSSTASGTGATCLSSGGRQLFFETATGETYDSDGFSYSASAVVRNGTVYVPLNFTCRFFGISLSTITGSEYGTVLRLATGAAVLTDAEFLKAAQSAMQTYAAAYEKGTASSAPQQKTESPQESEPPQGDRRAELSVMGLPQDAMLDRMAASGIRACFFLTADEVRSAPDTVRRMVCEGHTLGVWCESDPAAEYEETSKLLFEAARVCTVLAAAPEGVPQTDSGGLVWCESAITAALPDGEMLSADVILTTLDSSPETVTLRLGTGEAAELSGLLLEHLIENRFTVSSPRETG